MTRFQDRPLDVAVGLPLTCVRGVWRDAVQETATGTSQTVEGTAVGSEDAVVVTSAVAYNDSGTASAIILYVWDGSTAYGLKHEVSLAQYESCEWSGFVVLNAGESIRAWFNGVAVNDTLKVQSVGYTMEG